jgi:hypothetical protein
MPVGYKHTLNIIRFSNWEAKVLDKEIILQDEFIYSLGKI